MWFNIFNEHHTHAFSAVTDRNKSPRREIAKKDEDEIDPQRSAFIDQLLAKRSREEREPEQMKEAA